MAAATEALQSLTSQVDASSHFELLGRALAGSLLELASVDVRDEAVDLHCKHAVPLRDYCYIRDRNTVLPFNTQLLCNCSVCCVAGQGESSNH